MTSPAEVVAGYSDRLPFLAAEVAAVPAPQALPTLLTRRSRVAELPCGPGHFLARYAAAGSPLMLIDANPAVLALAQRRALAAGIPPSRLSTRCALLADLPRLDAIEVAVLPGGALNQLAAQTGLADLLGLLHRTLRSGARLLVQLCCLHSDGGQDRAGFLDPVRPDGSWFTDRRWALPAAGPATERLRRQHHLRADLYRVDFAYRTPTGAVAQETTIEVLVPSATALTGLLDKLGFTDIALTAGREHGLSELLCTATGGSPP